MTPYVSVIMTAYNGQNYIAEAIQSVLDQTYHNFELIIIDDGSTDDTALIIQTYTDPRIRHFTNQQNLGLARTLNKGRALARGHYITGIDSDDLMLPNRLKKQVFYMEHHPDIDYLGTSAYHIDNNSTYLSVHRQPSTPYELKFISLFTYPFYHASVFMRRNYIEKHHICYIEKYRTIAEDFELLSRYSNAWKLMNLTEPLYAFRKHIDSVSAKHNVNQITEKQRIALQNITTLFTKQNRPIPALVPLLEIFYGKPVNSYKELTDFVTVFEQIRHCFDHIYAHNTAPCLRAYIGTQIIKILLKNKHLLFDIRIIYCLLCKPQWAGWHAIKYLIKLSLWKLPYFLKHPF